MSVEAEKVLRKMLSKVGTSNEEIDQTLQRVRGEKYSILQVIEKCLKCAPPMKKACQQSMDKHRSGEDQP